MKTFKVYEVTGKCDRQADDDGGRYRSFEVSEETKDVYIEVGSWDLKGKHSDIDHMLRQVGDRKVRITVEVILEE